MSLESCRDRHAEGRFQIFILELALGLQQQIFVCGPRWLLSAGPSALGDAAQNEGQGTGAPRADAQW